MAAAAAGAPVASPAKIYVGNLNKSTTEEQLHNFFGKENVQSIEIRPQASFCWITFNSEEAAKAALAFNGRDLDGFAIKVEEHRPKPPRATPNKVVNPNCVFVGNLPPTFEAEQLTRLFEKYGTIEGVRLRQFRGPGRSGTVTFSAPEAAQAALELNGTSIEDRSIRVEIEARVRRQGKSKKKKQNALQQNAQNNNGQNAQAPVEDTPPNPLRVFVGNIPRDLGKEALVNHFASCGVSDAVAFRKGFGFVTLNNPEGVAAALALAGTNIGERPITVKPEERKENRNRQPRRSPVQSQTNQASQGQSGQGQSGQGQSGQGQSGQGQTGGGQGRRPRRRRKRGAAGGANNAASAAGGQDDSKSEAKSDVRNEAKTNNNPRRGKQNNNNVNNAGGNNNNGNVNGAGNNTGNAGNNNRPANRRTPRPKSNPETTVWVGNLPEGTSKEQILAAAEQVGPVVRVRFPTRNKYFAFVEFESPESVEKAVQRQFFTIGDENAKIERMHGRDCRVFLGKLAPTTDEAQLRAVLEPFGEVLSIALRTTQRKPEQKEGGGSVEGGAVDEEKTFAHVTFGSSAAAQQVLKGGTLKVAGVDVNPQPPRLRIRRRRIGGTAAARL